MAATEVENRLQVQHDETDTAISVTDRITSSESVDKPTEDVPSDKPSSPVSLNHEQSPVRTEVETHSPIPIDNADGNISTLVPDTVDNTSQNGLITGDDAESVGDASSVNNDKAGLNEPKPDGDNEESMDSHDVAESPVHQEEGSQDAVPGLLPEVRLLHVYKLTTLCLSKSI